MYWRVGFSFRRSLRWPAALTPWMWGSCLLLTAGLFLKFSPLLGISPVFVNITATFSDLNKAPQLRPTSSKTPVQQDYGITQSGSRPVKALCSNEWAAQKAGGTQESKLEFARSDAVEGFCEQHRRFLSSIWASESRICSTKTKKWLSLYSLKEFH